MKKLSNKTVQKMIICFLAMMVCIYSISNSSIFVRANGEVREKEAISETAIEEVPTTKEITIEIPTTEVPTTKVPTTEVPTTKAPVTEVPTTGNNTTGKKPVPWGKNAEGKFLNGNGDVIKGATMKGIDVSKWNGTINWEKVAATDVDYAIIRCGYGDNDKSQDDAYWEKNVKGCEKYNIPYGVYIYSYAETVAQAKSEVEHVLRLVGNHRINFPIYLDVEDKVQMKLPKATLTKIINTFVSAIHNAGYEVGIYANLNWWTNYIDSSIAGNATWFKWVAQYNNTGSTYTGVYQMWQCTSEGRVDGIYGDVDINFWYGAVRDRNYNAKNIIVQTPKKVVTAPKRVTIKSLKAGKKKIKIKIKKVSGAKGYQIQYATKSSFQGKKTKNTTKRTLTIKKLKSKKKYYFRVKAYKLDGKKKVYSKKWSKVKKVKVK